MPRLSAYFVRAALVYMLSGFFIGGLMLANKGVLNSPLIWRLLPLHVEITLLGWLVQLALGVAFWILPRLPGNAPRGDERLSWAAFALLNAGIGLSVLGLWVASPWLAGLQRGLELAALVSFAAGSWKRIKPMM